MINNYNDWNDENSYETGEWDGYGTDDCPAPTIYHSSYTRQGCVTLAVPQITIKPKPTRLKRTINAVIRRYQTRILERQRQALMQQLYAIDQQLIALNSR
jgi:ribosomal protein S30